MDPDSIPRSIFFAIADGKMTGSGKTILFILALILLGGFFAGTETAYSNCSRIRLMSWADDGKADARRALRILDKFDKMIITLLIGNNVVHVVATALAALWAIRMFGPALGSVLSTVVMTLLIFIFSETIPKNIAKVRADEWAENTSGILSLLMILFTPLALLFMGLGNVLKFLFHSKNDGPAITEDDFQTMIETIEDEGGLEAEESELIQSAVEFTERTVSEILTPRVHMVGLDLDDSAGTNFQTIIDEKFSRMPVYEGDMDHIVGILSTKQYLQHQLAHPGKRPDIRSLMAEPYFIRGDMSLHALVDEMRSRQMHLAIVQDQWGGTEGMVTLEDLLEELVGDIWDEDEEVTA